MAAPVYITDSSSVVWQIGVTNAGAFTTTVVGASGPSSYLLQDTITSTIYSLTILTSGALQVTVSSGTPTTILLDAPNGTPFQLVVASGALTIIPAAPETGLGLVIGTFQKVDGTPINGYAQFQLSAEGRVFNTACFAPTTVNFPVAAGSLAATVVFNDQLLPGGSTYQISVKDWNGLGGQVWSGKYSLTAGTASINVMVPL